MTKLYFQTEPEGGVCLYHRSSYGVVNRAAHIPLDMSLDEADQRLLADEWMLRTFPEPLPASTVRRIITHHRAEQKLSAALDSGAAHG